jgi:mannose-P-dolichol utilization defect protein 1
VTLAYSVRNSFPFSTYGENLFLTVQNVLISVLIASMAPVRGSNRTFLVLALYGISTYVLSIASDSNLALLQLGTLPLSVASKLPQITQNARARSTGQLSGFAVFSQLLGSLARLFTTMTEVGDARMGAGFALACALNAVLAYQIISYGSAPVIEEVPIDIRAEQETGSVLAEKGTGPVQWGAEAPGSKPQLTSTMSSPRKWTRKLDE